MSDLRAACVNASLASSKVVAPTAVPFFGTIVAVDTKPQQQADEHVQWFQILARLAALEVPRPVINERVAA